jgi:hypothetical protein
MGFLKDNWSIVVYLVTLLIGVGEYIAKAKEFDRRIIKLEEQTSEISKTLGDIREKLVELKTIISLRGNNNETKQA